MIRELLDPAFNPMFEGMTFEKLQQQGWARGAVGLAAPAGNQQRQMADPQRQDRDLLRSRSRSSASIRCRLICPSAKGSRTSRQRRVIPLQVISAATHYFIGATFQHVARLQDMMSRPTFEVSPQDAAERGIRDGDLCRLYNDRGEDVRLMR